MTAECSKYRSLIPRAAMGDLATEDQQSLGVHLAECGPCGEEHAQYLETLRQMRAVNDVPVPKHFFVYAKEWKENPWVMFRRMSPAWQGAVAAAVVLFVVLAASAAARMNIRTDNGSWIISFGPAPPPQPVPLPVPVIDTAAIEARVLNALEEKTRNEKLEWVRTLRAEVDKSNRSITERQRRVLQTALTDLEARFGGQLAATARTVEDRSDRSLSNLYQAISTERERDLAYINIRLNRFVAHDEVRSNQTDAILETLLQVAELKTK
ncbi:MAG TPA: hypothetical protein VE398_20050 [Acidobacteriota bacterium]|nr:hypothetical protein [Acidobacteriota bacterium]